jgi:penicillin-binding protein 2
MYLQRPPSRPEPSPDPVPLALRAAALGVIAAALLGVLLFRLWALQVLHSDQYVAAAAQNSIRTLTMPSPRGQILDRNGNVLVSNTATIAVQVDAARLPHGTACGPTLATHQVHDQAGCGVLKRLAWVLDVPYRHMWHTFSHLAKANPGYPVTLPFDVTRRETAYVLERRWLFPGVAFEHVYQRTYPSLEEFGATNPNLLGFVGAITAENLKDRSYHEKLPMIGTAGQAGIEKAYDRYLRGQDGRIEETVDPAGAPVGQAFLTQSPIAGDNLRLTIDAHLQKAAQYAVGQGIAIAHANGEVQADYGAVVAMNPDNGAIYAMASSPTYSPMVHVPPFKGSKAVFKSKLTPAYDKAFQGTYPAGSTFKPMTATAAYESGILAPGESLDCPGSYISRHDIAKEKTVFHDWTTVSMGMMALPKALEVSCDTFFYQLGDDFWGRGGNNEFQGWLRKLGYGSAPPLDAGGAQPGVVPDPTWKASQTWPGTPAQQAIEQAWLPGDDINMSIGQGNLLVSPLQQAVAYSALANGGKVVTPHVGQAILEPGSTTQAIPGGRIDPGPVRDLHLPQELLSEIRDGLFGATHAGDGTSSATFANFQPTVYGKTGTAEVPTVDCPDCADAWWAGWAEQDGKPLVVVAFIHNGGHGGVSAAPVAASVFQAFYNPRNHYSFHAGSDQSR